MRNPDQLDQPDQLDEIIDTQIPNPCEEVIAKDMQEYLKKVMSNYLLPREKQVLEMRFGIGHEQHEQMTQKAIGKLFSVRAARIRSLEYRALRKLRHPKALNKLSELSS